MSGQPMDPAVERLARALVTLDVDSHPTPVALHECLRATLRAHDHWQVEAERLESIRSKLGRILLAECEKSKHWRSRCPVTADDVEAAGVTPAHASEWARSAGWCESDGEAWPLSPRPFGLLRLSRPGEKRECTTCLFDDGADDNLSCVARLCNEAAKGDPRCPLDILDEMAALELP